MFWRRLDTTILFSVLVLGAGCTRPVANTVVGHAGSRVLTARDVAYRDAIVRLESPEETRALGFYQLCRAYELAEVLRLNGRPVTPDALVREAERIESASRDKYTLSRIRAIFDDDVEAYHRVYVLPVLVGRIGPYDFFRNDPIVQAPTRLRAERFLARVRKAPSTFVTRGAADSFREFEVSRADGWRWISTNGIESIGDRALGEKWISEVLPKLRPGQVFDSVVDLGERWLVARYRGAHKAVHRFDAALFERGDFFQWLDRELVAHPDARCVAAPNAKAR